MEAWPSEGSMVHSNQARQPTPPSTPPRLTLFTVPTRPPPSNTPRHSLPVHVLLSEAPVLGVQLGGGRALVQAQGVQGGSIVAQHLQGGGGCAGMVRAIRGCWHRQQAGRLGRVRHNWRGWGGAGAWRVWMRAGAAAAAAQGPAVGVLPLVGWGGRGSADTPTIARPVFAVGIPAGIQVCPHTLCPTPLHGHLACPVVSWAHLTPSPSVTRLPCQHPAVALPQVDLGPLVVAWPTVVSALRPCCSLQALADLECLLWGVMGVGGCVLAGRSCVETGLSWQPCSAHGC